MASTFNYATTHGQKANNLDGIFFRVKLLLSAVYCLLLSIAEKLQIHSMKRASCSTHLIWVLVFLRLPPLRRPKLRVWPPKMPPSLSVPDWAEDGVVALWTVVGEGGLSRTAVRAWD